VVAEAEMVEEVEEEMGVVEEGHQPD